MVRFVGLKQTGGDGVPQVVEPQTAQARGITQGTPCLFATGFRRSNLQCWFAHQRYCSLMWRSSSARSIIILTAAKAASFNESRLCLVLALANGESAPCLQVHVHAPHVLNVDTAHRRV